MDIIGELDTGQTFNLTPPWLVGYEEDNMKLEIITNEIEHCGECSNCDYNRKRYRCLLKKKRIPEIWGEIPTWCPLEDARVK